MKKFISRIVSAATCAGILFSTASAVSAETINVDPDYPIHGNKCGIIYINPEFDRDVYVTITQYTPDGDYVYYDTIIPAAGEATGENVYTFLVEGKEDISYDITIGVPKYKTSNEPQSYTYSFSVLDTDDITDEEIAGYAFYFDLVGGSEFKYPQFIYSFLDPKDENNIVVDQKQIYYPIADYILGDVNFDGNVNLYDAIDIAKYMLNKNYFNSEQLIAGDFDENGSVDIYDAIGIAKMLLSK